MTLSSLLGLVGAHILPRPPHPEEATRHQSLALTADRGVDFEAGELRLHIDDRMRLAVFLSDGTGEQTITALAPSQRIVTGDATVEEFVLDRERVRIDEVTGEFGRGQMLTVVGKAAPSGTTSVELTLRIEAYDRYPQTVLTMARYRNLGTQRLELDSVWPVTLTLDRRLSKTSERPYGFKTVSMGTVWGNGLRDRIWDVGPRSLFENYNGGDVTNPEMDGPWGGGGTPITTVWGRELGMTLAVVEPSIEIVGVPVETVPDGRVRLAVKQTIDLTDIPPGKTFTSTRCSLTAHHGDFFDGVAVFGNMLRDLGLKTRRYNDVDYEPYWCSYGLEDRLGLSPADPDEVDRRLYIPRDLGLEWVNIDSGWDNGTGSFAPNEELFDGEGDIKRWIDSLHRSGFKVSFWLDPGFGDDALWRKHRDWFIRGPDGDYWVDDWGRYIMDPTVKGALDEVRAGVAKLVKTQSRGGWGIDRMFLDGTFLPPPDWSGRHESPHDTERAGDAFIRATYQVARGVRADFPIEFCPCGGAITAWILPYFSQTTTSDPDVMSVRPHEVRTKLYKALVGPDAPVNSDHIEGAGEDLRLDMRYMFPVMLGLGTVYQTYYWRESWTTGDPLGVGDKALYQQWFGLYDTLQLSRGTYLNLYDLAYDKPGSQTIAKGDEIYYLFAPKYGQSFRGRVQLRGLKSGVTYRISAYDTGTDWGTATGPTAAEYQVSIAKNRALVLKATPAGTAQMTRE